MFRGEVKVLTGGDLSENCIAQQTDIQSTSRMQAAEQVKILYRRSKSGWKKQRYFYTCGICMFAEYPCARRDPGLFVCIDLMIIYSF